MERRSNQPGPPEESAAAVAGLLAALIGQAVLFNEQVARALGIGSVDLQAFGVISRNAGPISPTEVTARTGLPASTTTRVLDRLEQAGYIARSAVPGDRRKVAVEVVEEKAAEVAQHYLGKIRQIGELNAKRTDAEVAAVISYLGELLEP